MSHANGALYNCPYEGCSYKTQKPQMLIQHRHQHKIREEKRFGCSYVGCSYVGQNSGVVSGKCCILQWSAIKTNVV